MYPNRWTLGGPNRSCLFRRSICGCWTERWRHTFFEFDRVFDTLTHQTNNGNEIFRFISYGLDSTIKLLQLHFTIAYKTPDDVYDKNIQILTTRGAIQQIGTNSRFINTNG